MESPAGLLQVPVPLDEWKKTAFSHVLVSGVGRVDFLKPGMIVNFRSSRDPATRKPMTVVKVFDPGLRIPLGTVSLGNVAPLELVTKPLALPPHLPGGAVVDLEAPPEGAEKDWYEYTGTLVSIDGQGQSIKVRIPKGRRTELMTFPVDPTNMRVAYRLSDLTLARPGDAIEVKGTFDLQDRFRPTSIVVDRGNVFDADELAAADVEGEEPPAAEGDSAGAAAPPAMAESDPPPGREWAIPDDDELDDEPVQPKGEAAADRPVELWNDLPPSRPKRQPGQRRFKINAP